MSYHDWIPLRVTPVEAPSSPVEALWPIPVVSVFTDVRVEHRAGWAKEAVVYHFDHEAYRWCPP